jgi:hypothetical protein
MSPEIIFNLHLILGYVAWLLCFGVYVLPRLKSMAWSQRNAPSLRCTASASSGWSLSFQASLARICPPLASPRSPPTGTWQPGCSLSWRFSR